MTDDEIIDSILTELFNADHGTLSVASYTTDVLKLGERVYPAFVDRLEAEGLAAPLNPRHRMTITDFGRQVYNAGGWFVHLDKLAKERQQQTDKGQLEIDLAKSNIEANRINQENTKLNKRVTIINIIIGIINLLVAFVSITIAYFAYKVGK